MTDTKLSTTPQISAEEVRKLVNLVDIVVELKKKGVTDEQFEAAIKDEMGEEKFAEYEKVFNS